MSQGHVSSSSDATVNSGQGEAVAESSSSKRRKSRAKPAEELITFVPSTVDEAAILSMKEGLDFSDEIEILAPKDHERPNTPPEGCFTVWWGCLKGQGTCPERFPLPLTDADKQIKKLKGVRDIASDSFTVERVKRGWLFGDSHIEVPRLAIMRRPIPSYRGSRGDGPDSVPTGGRADVAAEERWEDLAAGDAAAGVAGVNQDGPSEDSPVDPIVDEMESGDLSAGAANLVKAPEGCPVPVRSPEASRGDLGEPREVDDEESPSDAMASVNRLADRYDLEVAKARNLPVLDELRKEKTKNRALLRDLDVEAARGKALDAEAGVGSPPGDRAPVGDDVE
ncbi:unnamed protein product [Cochlearia groenlandica]